MQIDSEMGVHSEIFINKNSIRNWGAPYAHELIDEKKRREILINVVTHFENRKFKVYVLPSY